MLLITCSQDACRNIELRMGSKAVSAETWGMPPINPVMRAGTMPNWNINWVRACGPKL
jgi:hypothetical protein